MGISCAHVSNEDMAALNKEKSKVVLARLKSLNVSTEGLT